VSVRIVVGDALTRLAEMPADSVHCVVTSPPYFGLRNYSGAPLVWGGDIRCDHQWSIPASSVDGPRHGLAMSRGLENGSKGNAAYVGDRRTPSDFCACGAWRGELGLEPAPDLFIAHLVEVFREVRRVLRADGTLWLNIGDSYAGSWGAQGRRETDAEVESWHGSQIKNHPKRASNTGTIRSAGVKPKDLYGIPWLLAFALRADGWWLRQDIIWSKPNVMPESVTDRCTKAHEYLFLLTKSENYFYDADAIAEPAASYSRQNTSGTKSPKTIALEASGDHGVGGDLGINYDRENRNKRSVWSITTQPYAGAHFATMPPALVEPCILAGTSAKGCCAACGRPIVRIVEKTRTRDGEPLAGGWDVNAGGVRLAATGVGHWRDKTETKTAGWEPSCACGAATVPAIVLDPFGGAGTVGLVADRLQRDAILIELNPKYADMAADRIDTEAGSMFGAVAIVG
jgi:DNA modification methylase